MRPIIYFVCLATLLITVSAAAQPMPNSAVINERVFNDCFTSVLTTTNNYAAMIRIEDDVLDCTGFANLHNWRFSEDGATALQFANGDGFRFGADLVIDGTSDGEAGLQISPWWSADVDGRLNVRSTDGEIACFGGRLPFYSFTATHGINYVKGMAIHLEITYLPNGLSETDPGTIEYEVEWMGMTYSSGVIPFDEGNPDEGPMYGNWGILNEAQAGGHIQAFLQAGNPDAGLSAEWRNITYESLGSVPVEGSSWGKIKSTYR